MTGLCPWRSARQRLPDRQEGEGQPVGTLLPSGQDERSPWSNFQGWAGSAWAPSCIGELCSLATIAGTPWHGDPALLKQISEHPFSHSAGSHRWQGAKGRAIYTAHKQSQAGEMDPQFLRMWNSQVDRKTEGVIITWWGYPAFCAVLWCG